MIFLMQSVCPFLRSCEDQSIFVCLNATDLMCNSNKNAATLMHYRCLNSRLPASSATKHKIMFRQKVAKSYNVLPFLNITKRNQSDWWKNRSNTDTAEDTINMFHSRRKRNVIIVIIYYVFICVIWSNWQSPKNCEWKLHITC